MHIKCIIVFETTSFHLLPPWVYLRYLNFIYFVHISNGLHHSFGASPAPFIPEWCREIRFKPHTRLLVESFGRFSVCGNANETKLCNMLFYFPIFDLLKMQISIEQPATILWECCASKARLSVCHQLELSCFASKLQIFNFPPDVRREIGIFWTLWSMLLFAANFILI